MNKVKIIISCVFIICVTIFAVKFFKSLPTKPSSTLSPNTINILYQATRLGNTMQTSCSYAPYGGLMREINAATVLKSNLKGATLYIDAGNSLIPFNRDKGTSSIPGTKEIETAGWIVKELAGANLDVMGIGQVDLNLSIPTLQKIQKESSLNFISSNVQDKKGAYPFPRYLIKEFDGVKFGIISVSSDKHVQNKNVVIKDPSSTIKELVPTLKNQGVNFIILLSQMTADQTYRIISALPQDIKIDVAVAADLYFSTSKVFWLQRGTSLLANQDFFGAYLGKLEIKYNSLPISIFSSPKQIEANKARIKQLESRLATAKDPTNIQKELDYLKSNSELSLGENATTYEGGLIGLDSSFDTPDTINLNDIKIINN